MWITLGAANMKVQDAELPEPAAGLGPLMANHIDIKEPSHGANHRGGSDKGSPGSLRTLGIFLLNVTRYFMHYDRRMIKVSGVAGVLGVLIYIVLAVSDPYIGPETKTTQEFLAAWGTPKYVAVNIALHFAFAGVFILWLVAFVGLKHLLGAEMQSALVDIGTLFGVVACAVMVQMTIVQGSVISKMAEAYISATGESERQSVVALYKGLRFIDLGWDLAFDMFFFSAWILLGFKMLRHRSFGRLFGGIGIFLFVLAAGLNLRAAPDPPTPDIGPIAALWTLAVYIQLLRSAKSIPDFQAEPPVP